MDLERNSCREAAFESSPGREPWGGVGYKPQRDGRLLCRPSGLGMARVPNPGLTPWATCRGVIPASNWLKSNPRRSPTDEVVESSASPQGEVRWAGDKQLSCKPRG